MPKILLVEDDNNLREIYGARLTAEGYNIISAPDGEEALAIAVKEKPDLIITDVMMPKISGFDMLDILRNAPETKDTKVIMMTALSQAEDKERADKLGADLYLVKSQVTLEDVAASVKMILAGESPGKAAEASSAPDEPVSAPEPAPAPEPPKPEPTPDPVPPPVPTPEPTPTPPVATPAVELASAPAETPTATQVPPSTTPSVATPAPEATPNTPVADTPVQAANPPIAAPPTPAASNPAPSSIPEPAKPAPIAKKIEVVLPDSKAEPAKEPSAATQTATEQPAEETPKPPEESLPSGPALDQALSVGPTLAEALAEEEKNSDSQAETSNNKKESTAGPTDNTATGPSTIVKPQNASPVDIGGSDEIDHTPPKLAGIPGKKVIEPINDLTKTPDLNELLAREESKGQIPPAPSNPSAATETTSPEHPDDFSKISL